MVSAKVITIDYTVCTGLYAYLRQVELSLDRALPSDVEGIRLYFCMPGVYDISYVVSFFENLLREKVDILFMHKDLKSNILFNFLQKNKLLISWDKMSIILLCLRRANELINYNHLDVEGFVNLRMLLSKISWEFIGKKMIKNYMLKSYKVSYYGCNENVNFKSIDEIIGKKWIN